MVITRAVQQAGPLAALLRAEGAEPIFLPVIETRPPPDPAALEAAAAGIAAYDLVALGSINAAESLVAALEAADQVCTAPVACVGRKTAEAIDADPMLAARLTGPRIVPETYRAEALVVAIEAAFASQGGVGGRRVLFPRAPEGRLVLAESLSAKGATVEALVAYRIVGARSPDPEALAAATAADAVTFLSGRTLSCWLKVVPAPHAQGILQRARVAVIGPVAAAEAERLGVRVDVVPPEATAEALVAALARSYATG